MITTRHYNVPHHRTRQVRRGNTIVLVTGILVLLVIIATGYITRTQSGRVTAPAQQRAELHEDAVNILADSLATTVAEALFVRPIDTTGLIGVPFQPMNSNVRRLSAPPDAVRYGVDPNFPYNFAPYHVVPFTNWPDPLSLGLNPANWPAGPGNPFAGGFGAAFTGEGNPVGNPGYGDTRWLRDTEPLRWDTRVNLPAIEDGLQDGFYLWKHLTTIATPENGFRVVADISDIDRSLITNLNVPYEQWLAIRPTNPTNTLYPIDMSPPVLPAAQARFTGHPQVLDDFWDRWGRWFNDYENTYAEPLWIPPNLYKLNDLDGDGIPHNFFIGGVPQDHPESEFIPGTARNWVSRVLADTDGDGFTDAFWHLAPFQVQDGIRTIVAVSIIDNASMLNANVATRFFRNDTDYAAGATVARRTRGLGPTDLALVGQRSRDPGSDITNLSFSNGNWNVGLFDNREHWFWTRGIPYGSASQEFIYRPDGWDQHAFESGWLASPTATEGVTAPLTGDRLTYWRQAAAYPLSTTIGQDRFAPFGLTDELELRAFHGNNFPWILSRFERSTHVGAINGGTPDPSLRVQLLRTVMGSVRAESSEYQDQLMNRELVRDLRRKVTLYNNTRNDLMPPWLWLYWPGEDFNNDGVVNQLDQDLNGDGFINVADYELFLAGASKFDLRVRSHLDGGRVVGDFDGNGYLEFADATPRNVGIALRDRIERALMDPLNDPNIPNPNSYYGPSASELNRTRELAAGLASNIVTYRMSPSELAGDPVNPNPILAPMARVVEVSSPPGGASNIGYLGMEPQPFLVEAFIGHVYKAITVEPDSDPDGTPYTNAGHHVVVEGLSEYSTVIAVQIANPFDVPIDLHNFQVTVYGQEISFPINTWLYPATDDAPTTAILYAIKGDDFPDRADWLSFLDIRDGASWNLSYPQHVDNQPIRTIVLDCTEGLTGGWNVSDRSRYDVLHREPITIRRIDQVNGALIVVDRFDSPTDGDFGQAVSNMATHRPPTALPPGQEPSPGPPPVGGPYPGIDLGPGSEGYDSWVQWVRVTRAWGVDVNADGIYSPNERNPRYVFGDRAVIVPTENTSSTYVEGGDKFKSADPPNGDPNAGTRPWFLRQYQKLARDPAGNFISQTVASKPTFFDLRWSPLVTMDRPIANYPDKGWYSQLGSVNQLGGVDDPLVDPGTGNLRIHLSYPMQMLHKGTDFEQVGELLNVWLYGHKLAITPGVGPALPTYTSTLLTFSEMMSREQDQYTASGVRVNRLQVSPVTGHSVVIGVGGDFSSNPLDRRHAIPELPAGARLLDAFVCDDIGLYNDWNGPLLNAKGFDGTGTPGLLNINTATPEVLRSVPHWYRLVHETGQLYGRSISDTGTYQLYTSNGQPLVTDGASPVAQLPRVMIPEAIMQYRDRFNGAAPYSTGIRSGPNYQNRGNGVRGDRGFASIGELLLLNKSANADMARQVSGAPVDPLPPVDPIDQIFSQYWRIDMGLQTNGPGSVGEMPFWDHINPAHPITPRTPASVHISTDLYDSYDPLNTTLVDIGNPLPPNSLAYRPDRVAGDAEEANALFAGASNMLTTRSDTFTVYFRVRSFRQNTSVNPPVWDATNPDYIVDDSRYVMLIDRSSVNRPGDRPRILYMEKLPN